MAYQVASGLEDGKRQVEKLVEAFGAQKALFKTPSYSEAQLRADFLDPLLKSLGWDVGNEAHKSQHLRDVKQEEPILVEQDELKRKKNPDYTLQLSGIRKFFLEAKKPSIDIINSAPSAFQTRRYGWNATLGISVLSNFEHLIIYDCRFRPTEGDGADVARYKIFHFQEFVARFEELHSLLSYESVSSGVLDSEFAYEDRVHQSFDNDFLSKIESWRKDFANDIISRNQKLNEEEINFLVHRLLNRVIFLRICEDRTLEVYERLTTIKDYNGLKNLFHEADKKYDSGLFDFIEDKLSLKISIGAELLIRIFSELYYPKSPYDFSVVDPEILSQIYEQWLGRRIHLGEQLKLSIIDEPEVVASEGVVPTPKLIVRKIVHETLTPLVAGKNADQLLSLRICDICCGSGSFLIATFDFLIQEYTRLWASNEAMKSGLVYRGTDQSWQLTIKTKKKILQENIFGVDINPYAVEVARFGLLLKLIEGENTATISDYLANSKEQILPSLDGNIKCGNSLLDYQYYDYNDAPSMGLLQKLNPFVWNEEFSFFDKNGGFDAIVGNPPYVRIQNMVKYFPEEIAYYQSKKSPYTVAQERNIDKYYLFIQRAIELLTSTGRLGYIVPNKFFILKGGEELRSTILETAYISKIVHFGVVQVFPRRSTYTAILILGKQIQDSFVVSAVNKISEESLFGEESLMDYQQADYSKDPWVFLSPEGYSLFQKLKTGAKSELQNIGEITVGLQTSADDIYIFVPTNIGDEFVQFERNGVLFEIETAITRPCLKDQRFKGFDQPEANAQMIFPYKIVDEKAVVLDESEFQSQFPKCWEYLIKFKERLEARSIVGKNPKWYQFGRSQGLTKFHDKDKLIWPVLSLTPNYGYDTKNIFFTGGGNGPYYSFLSGDHYSIFYILGIISHPAIEAMVKAYASHFGGGYYSHGKQFIQNLPIKTIDFSKSEEVDVYNQIIDHVQRIIELRGELIGTRVPSEKEVLNRRLKHQEGKLIGIVCLLYGITELEMEVVRGKRYLIDHTIE